MPATGDAVVGDDTTLAQLLPSAERDEETSPPTFGGKTITFVGSVALLTNNILGPGIFSLPSMFQESGWLFPLLVLVGLLPALIYFNGLPDSPGIELMSIFEISLLITFMSTFITFIPDFRRSHFSLLVWHDDRRYSITERLQTLDDGDNTGSSYRAMNDDDSKVVVP